LDELFRTGSIKHIDSVLAKIPESVFPLLLVPGLGPKRAYKLGEELHLKNKKTAIEELEKALRDHKVASIEGFGEKSENDILQNIATFKKGAIKEKRILLSEADQIAENLISFLKKNNSIERIDILGSLRRFVATIGDIDIAIISKDPEKAISYFCTYPHVKIIEQGPTGASLLLHNGRQVDLRVQEKRSYGAMLQYFTGSKNHNIALRSYALTKHLSLSEYGIKDMSRQLASRRSGSSAISHQKKEGVKQFDNEKAFYEYLGMQYVPPELREDRGEIEHAINHTLPTLVEVSDIKGDFHIHTNYNLEPSHDLGLHSLEEILDEADALGYEYIGISDHNPSIGNHNDSEIISIMKKRHEYYKKHAEEWNTRHHKNIYVFTMLEVDIKPDGTLALPEEAFAYVDAVIASIHSSFAMTKEDMTVRIIRGISSHPKVRILGHPTGRLLNRREGFEVDWKKIFDVAKKKDIALEINASPYRLDLPDALVYDAVKFGCRLTIDSDAHQKEDMNMMKYGVSVGRRGWAEKRDICNTYSYNEMKKWLMPK
jgi:DNA polymerase (family 10)